MVLLTNNDILSLEEDLKDQLFYHTDCKLSIQSLFIKGFDEWKIIYLDEEISYNIKTNLKSLSSINNTRLRLTFKRFRQELDNDLYVTNRSKFIEAFQFIENYLYNNWNKSYIEKAHSELVL